MNGRRARSLRRIAQRYGKEGLRWRTVYRALKRGRKWVGTKVAP